MRTPKHGERVPPAQLLCSLPLPLEKVRGPPECHPWSFAKIVLPTSLLKISPTAMGRTPPAGFFNAISRAPTKRCAKSCGTRPFAKRVQKRARALVTRSPTRELPHSTISFKRAARKPEGPLAVKGAEDLRAWMKSDSSKLKSSSPRSGSGGKSSAAPAGCRAASCSTAPDIGGLFVSSNLAALANAPAAADHSTERRTPSYSNVSLESIGAQSDLVRGRTQSQLSAEHKIAHLATAAKQNKSPAPKI